MAKPTAQPVQIKGRPLRCQFCGEALFLERRAKVHGALASFFNFEWASPSARCYVCQACGYLHWFLPPPESGAASPAPGAGGRAGH
jgi:hypothetical protein